MAKFMADIIKVNPFIFSIVVLQIGAFVYSLFTRDYKPGILMLVYALGNAIIGWMR